MSMKHKKNVASISTTFLFLTALGLIHVAMNSCSNNDTQTKNDRSTVLPDSKLNDQGSSTFDGKQDAPMNSDKGASDKRLLSAEAKPVDFGLTLNDGGCLTYASASKICGFNSDESICKFAVSCKISTDVGQCKINCEMGVTVSCMTMTNFTCMKNAVASADCAALNKCNWVL
jgi:hypothetical protein